MKRLFQLASLVLMLLMLAPSAFASMQCVRNPETHSCPRSCCNGMDGMSMPMDQSGSDGCAQVIHAPCCTMTQTEIAMSASPAKTHAGNMIAHVELPSLLLPIDLHPVSAWFVEFPPGNTLTGPVLSRLCSFQI